jgi:hypothetical protein
MFQSPRVVLVALAAVAMSAAPLRAQAGIPAATPFALSAPRPVAPAASRAPAGPSIAAEAVAARPAATRHAEDSTLAPMRRRAQFSQGQTLMIVGGAAFVAGALIGDDAGTVVMIGGAVVGLYGLYLYLQQ